MAGLPYYVSWIQLPVRTLQFFHFDANVEFPKQMQNAIAPTNIQTCHLSWFRRESHDFLPFVMISRQPCISRFFPFFFFIDTENSTDLSSIMLLLVAEVSSYSSINKISIHCFDSLKSLEVHAWAADANTVQFYMFLYGKITISLYFYNISRLFLESPYILSRNSRFSFLRG